jgi:hypothetical protein
VCFRPACDAWAGGVAVADLARGPESMCALSLVAAQRPGALRCAAACRLPLSAVAGLRDAGATCDRRGARRAPARGHGGTPPRARMAPVRATGAADDGGQRRHGPVCRRPAVPGAVLVPGSRTSQ